MGNPHMNFCYSQVKKFTTRTHTYQNSHTYYKQHIETSSQSNKTHFKLGTVSKIGL